MKLPHSALIVIEDADDTARYRWLRLRATADPDRVEEFEASDESFATPPLAFDAGATRWRQALSIEDEDADPVGDPAPE